MQCSPDTKPLITPGSSLFAKTALSLIRPAAYYKTALRVYRKHTFHPHSKRSSNLQAKVKRSFQKLLLTSKDRTLTTKQTQELLQTCGSAVSAAAPTAAAALVGAAVTTRATAATPSTASTASATSSRSCGSKYEDL